MQIKEECKRWQMVFDLEDSTLSEKEVAFVKAILHTAGDVAQMIDSLPEEPELRLKTLQALAYVVAEAQGQIEAVVQHAAFKHMLRQPLGEGFTYEKIFGRDIDQELMDLAQTEEETLMMQEEYLINEGDEEPPEEEDGHEDEDN